MKLNTHIDISASEITDYRLSVAKHSLVALVDNNSIYFCNLVLSNSPTDTTCDKLISSSDTSVFHAKFESINENT